MAEVITSLLKIWDNLVNSCVTLITQNPADVSGEMWNIVKGIMTALQGIATPLAVVFFIMSLFKYTTRYQDLNLQNVGGGLLRLVLTMGLIVLSDEIVMLALDIGSDTANAVLGVTGGNNISNLAALPEELQGWIENINFWDLGTSLVKTLVGGLLIITTFACIVLLMLAIYGRYIRIIIHLAFSPVGMSFFAGDATMQNGRSYVMSLLQIAFEAAVIVVTILIVGIITSMDIQIFQGDGNANAWLNYIVKAMFSQIICVVNVFGAPKLIKQMFGG